MDKEIRFLVYNAADENVSVNAIVKNESIRLTQKAMGELFGCSSDNISLHLKNIYEVKELDKEATTEKISVVQKEGGKEVSRMTRN